MDESNQPTPTQEKPAEEPAPKTERPSAEPAAKAQTEEQKPASEPAEEKAKEAEPKEADEGPKVSEKGKEPSEEPSEGEAKKEDAKPAAKPSPLGNVLLFGRFDVSEVHVDDPGIARYVDITPVAVPHTGGKHSTKQFGKAKMSIVERLINGMMRTEDFTGKKIKSYKAVERAFIIIDEKTRQNPLQVLVDALQNAAPREEVTRLQYGGISVPKAVDVAPARRVDLALRHICRGALESSHKSMKPIEECLADEVIAAAKGDVSCHSVSKKEEIERVAASAR